MPKQERHKTSYPGVYYILGAKGKDDQIFYIQYRNAAGKLIEEKIGRRVQGWSAAKANRERVDRLNGKTLSNQARREAEKVAKEAEAGKMTISRLWEFYKEDHKTMACLPSDESRFKLFIEPSFGDKEPSEIVPLDIDRLKRKVLEGKAAQTIKHVLTLLTRVANCGVKKQLCQEGLSFRIQTPTIDNQVTEDLAPGALSRLLKTLNDSDDVQVSRLMLMAVYTGMRKGELLKLRWKDVDFETGFITIRSPKGKKSMKIPMSQSVKTILERHPRSGEHVFVNDKGKPFVEIRKQVDVIRKAAGLPPEFRPLHGLRHVYASMLASSGKVEMYTLQKLLTHKSPQMTQRYAHLRDEALRDASNVAESIIGKAMESVIKAESSDDLEDVNKM
jgi:integrase